MLNFNFIVGGEIEQNSVMPAGGPLIHIHCWTASLFQTRNISTSLMKLLCALVGLGIQNDVSAYVIRAFRLRPLFLRN